ncbi:unnamed protein product [Trifolium pratense]|uniref:Uncharacterized protein n=1 Tax=Trifolium pratense TaxID=57577 RepID=A0ACB0J4P8_TRIPR|nr:unnamed protein product [Trifolium pratense]
MITSFCDLSPFLYCFVHVLHYMYALKIETGTLCENKIACTVVNAAISPNTVIFIKKCCICITLEIDAAALSGLQYLQNLRAASIESLR